MQASISEIQMIGVCRPAAAGQRPSSPRRSHGLAVSLVLTSSQSCPENSQLSELR